MTNDRPWPTTDWHPGGPEPRAMPHARIPAGGYHRPALGLWHLWFIPPAMKAAALYGVAACATSVLCGIRIWQALTQHDDETGD